jgi:hypothetical protein
VSVNRGATTTKQGLYFKTKKTLQIIGTFVYSCMLSVSKILTPDGSYASQLSSRETPSLIHAVAAHFSPSSTGQLLCSVNPSSILPFSPMYEKNTVVPFLGFKNKLEFEKVIPPPLSATYMKTVQSLPTIGPNAYTNFAVHNCRSHSPPTNMRFSVTGPITMWSTLTLKHIFIYQKFSDIRVLVGNIVLYNGKMLLTLLSQIKSSMSVGQCQDACIKRPTTYDFLYYNSGKGQKILPQRVA